MVNGGRVAYVTTRKSASDTAREMVALGLDVGPLIEDGRWVFVGALTRPGLVPTFTATNLA